MVDADLGDYVRAQLTVLLDDSNVVRVNKAQYDFRYKAMEICSTGLGRMTSDKGLLSKIFCKG